MCFSGSMALRGWHLTHMGGVGKDESFVFTLTECAVLEYLRINGTILSHLFTCYVGLAVGASLVMMISPAATYAPGMMGCTVCMLGYRYLSHLLARRLWMQDKC